jgi:hypothetical protein
MKCTVDQILKAIYESGLHQYIPAVLAQITVDGISTNVPSISLINFVRKLEEKPNE